MLHSSSLNMVRLQELKLWQGNYDEHTQKNSDKKVVSEKDEKHLSESIFNTSIEKVDTTNWDKHEIVPSKPFEELLEEKIAQDLPIQIRNKPKRPFLKKGQGTARFKMAQYPTNIKQTSRLKDLTNSDRKGILKRATVQVQENINLTPLTVQECMKPRGTWKAAFENGSTEKKNQEEDRYDKFRRNLYFKSDENFNNHCKTDNASIFSGLNKSIMEKIKAYASKSFSPNEKLISNDIPENLLDIMIPYKKDPGEHILEEQKSERELKNFEMLEQKVENSSFCSTNTSVMNLLASTPQKNYSTTNITDKDVSAHRSSKMTSRGTSFSDEETRWSSRSPSVVDNYTEYDSTCQSESVTRIDAGVNTSFDSFKLDDTVKNDEPCTECEVLKSKLLQKTKSFNNLQTEHEKLKKELNELDGKYNNIKKEMNNNEKKYTEQVAKLEEEMTSERKKYLKEKNYFENYIKDAQNRPSKKEREEISQLKQELADAKELLKLKDTKYGASQARLRTQVKQQEKELTELKATVEKLHKENAKLSSNQKYMRRPAEVKMLQEINKNLSKLTEETFKKKVEKSGKGNGDEKQNVVSDISIQGSETIKTTPKETEEKSVTTRSSRNSLKNDSVELNFINYDTVSIEKQYEHKFGNVASPRNTNCSATLDKSENVLPDGSIEISYSNGNLKTISSDGQLIKMKYFNGDTKETDLKNNIIKYHYASTNSLHTQYPDGSELLEYSEGQKCKKYPDGKTEVSYSDGSIRLIYPDGTEEQQFPDGRRTVKHDNGEQIIFLPNGQKEVHNQNYKRREYPDGTVRTLYKDGTVETVYSNGRVRLKDSDGVLVMDTYKK
ncbi:centromere protein J isoform X2 [Sitophilus oryzae]|uniref:Centromere protein J isoform X2 n=1 Tax=Sitophilus oryzae TaxID=7048 RepID=A0A6J2XQP8_SITOR|nr:centromere protein J isoform X2 [Sitophilus oryzae]